MKSKLSVRILLLLWLLTIVFPMTAGAAEKSLVALSPDDLTTYNNFGVSVALDGQYAVAGADGANAAYILKRVTTGWFVKQKITSGSPDPDQFGIAASISENQLIVGASTGNSNKGIAYIFSNSADNWTSTATLTANVSSGGWFGKAVCIDGDYAIVGALRDNADAIESGSAYVFKFNGTDWGTGSKLLVTGLQEYDHFGTAVSVSGEYAIIGAPEDDTAGSNAGAAYVFKRNSTSWSQIAKLTVTGSISFGASVSVSGNYAVIGAYGTDSNKGAAYIYQLESGSWNQKATLTASDGSAGDKFGKSVSVFSSASGTKAFIGAEEAGSRQGAAYLFELSGSTWTQSDKYLAQSSTTNELFGSAVAISEEYLFAGAKGRNTSTGAVYVDASGVDPNFSPTLSDVDDQYTNDFSEILISSVTFGDQEGGTLEVWGTSDNSAVVTDGNIRIGGVSAPPTSPRSINLGAGTSASLSLSITPSGYGKANITISVRDAGGKITTETFGVIVSHKPTIDSISDQQMNEDTSSTVSITVRDEDMDTLNVNVTVSSGNPSLFPSGSITIEGDLPPYEAVLGSSTSALLSLTFEPAENESGSATITVEADDGSGKAQSSFTVTVDAVNDPPTISAISDQAIDEDQTLGPISFTINDVEDGTSLTVEASSDNQSLVPDSAISIGGTGSARTVTLTPAQDAFGSVEITITVTDAGDASAQEAFALTVTQLTDDDSPIISDISDKTMNEDDDPPKDPAINPISFTVYHGDSVATTLTVTSSNPTLLPDNVTDASAANITVNGAVANSASPYSVTFIGTEASADLVIQPAANQVSTAVITITATDTNGNTDVETFTLTVVEVNDSPTISEISPLTTAEDTATDFISYTIGDVETPATSLTVSFTQEDPDGIISQIVQGPETGTTRSFKVIPAANKSGTATITVTVQDTGGATASRTFSFEVTPENDLPAILPNPLPTINMEEDETATVLTQIPFTIQDIDIENLTVSISTGDTNNSSLFQSIHLGGGTSGPPTLIIPKDNLDAEGKASLVASVKLGADEFGWAYLVIEVTDTTGTSAESTFLVNVASVNDPPTISGTPSESATVGEEYSFIPTASDPEDDTADLSFNIVSKPSWATFDPATGTLSGTPDDGDVGTTAGIQIFVTDSESESASVGPFSITVERVESAPVINDENNISAQETAENTTIEIPFTITDKNGDVLTVSAGISPTDSGLVRPENVRITGIDANNQVDTERDVPVNLTLKISPEEFANSDKDGTVTVTVTVTDDSQSQLTATATFTLTVTPVATDPLIWDDNDLPLTNQIFQTDENTPKTIFFKLKDWDWGAFDITATSGKTDLVPSDNIDIGERGTSSGFGPSYSTTIASDDPKLLEIVITPAEFEFGTAKITLTAASNGRTAKAEFVLQVNAVDNPPEISSATNLWTMTENTSAGFSLTVDDPDGNDVLLIIDTQESTKVPADGQHIQVNGSGYMAGGILLTQAVYANPVTITITPAEFANTDDGTPVQITVTAQETDTLKDTATFNLQINGINNAPTFEFIESQTINEDNDPATDPIPISVDDPDGDKLVISLTSSDESVVIPESVILMVGTTEMSLPAELTADQYRPATSEDSLSLKVVPVSHANTGSGSISLTISAEDVETLSDSAEFRLRVAPQPDAPEISDIADQKAVDEDNELTVNFSVKDVDGGTLTVKVSSDQPGVVPNNKSNLVLSGASGVVEAPLNGQEGALQWVQSTVNADAGTDIPVTLTILPEQDTFTTTDMTITITVSDGTGTSEATESFTLRVDPINDAPAVSDIPTKSVTVESEITVSFDVMDIDTDLSLLDVTARSGDTDLVAEDSYHLDLQKISSNPATGTVTYELTVRPNTDASITGDFSSTNITIRANDGTDETDLSFELRVFPKTVQKPEIQYDFDVDSIQLMTEDVAKSFTFTVLYTLDSTPVSNPGFDIVGLSSEDTTISGGNIEPVYIGSTDAEHHNYRLDITPSPNAFTANYPADAVTITVLANVNGYTTDKSFEIFISSVIDSPEITLLFTTPVTTYANEAKTLEFVVSDPDSEANDLDIVVTNEAINAIGIKTKTLSCTDGNCTLKITPVESVTTEHRETVTITVTDSDGASDTENFEFQVRPNNAPSVIFSPTSGKTDCGAPYFAPFTVGDPNGGVLTLSVSPLSEIPSGIIDSIAVTTPDGTQTIVEEFGTDGTVTITPPAESASLILRITPAAETSGTAQLRVTVTDPSGMSDTDDFELEIITPGDLDTDCDVDLTDAILALQVVSGISVSDVNPDAEVGSNGRIGIEEAIYILQEVAGLR